MMQAYYESRQLARIASPRMMQGLIEDADNAEDERVRSVCRLAVLDRAGIRPTDFDPEEGKGTVRLIFRWCCLLATRALEAVQAGRPGQDAGSE